MRSLVIVVLLLASCRGRDDDASTIAKDPSAASAKPTAKPAPPPSPTPDADASDAEVDAATIVLPAIDTSCAVDADCAVTFDATSGPETCCWWCGSTAGNVAWVKRVEAICKAKRPGNCPSIDCPAGPMKAKCDKGKCVGVF